MTVSRQFTSVESWSKKSSGSWTAKQSSGLNPGSEAAVSRRRQGKKYKARGKKVIRPRIRKQHEPDTKAK